MKNKLSDIWSKFRSWMKEHLKVMNLVIFNLSYLRTTGWRLEFITIEFTYTDSQALFGVEYKHKVHLYVDLLFFTIRIFDKE